MSELNSELEFTKQVNKLNSNNPSNVPDPAAEARAQAEVDNWQYDPSAGTTVEVDVTEREQYKMDWANKVCVFF